MKKKIGRARKTLIIIKWRRKLVVRKVLLYQSRGRNTTSAHDTDVSMPRQRKLQVRKLASCEMYNSQKRGLLLISRELKWVCLTFDLTHSFLGLFLSVCEDDEWLPPPILWLFPVNHKCDSIQFKHVRKLIDNRACLREFTVVHKVGKQKDAVDNWIRK